MRAIIPLLLVCSCAATAVEAEVSPAVAAEQAELLAADRAFDTDTAARGVDGWVSWFATNGSMVHGDAPPVVGHDAIRALMTPVFAAATLRWQPERAEVLIPGALGVTVGSFLSTKVDDSGASKESTGHYISVWKKTGDGWKVILDTGVPDPE